MLTQVSCTWDIITSPCANPRFWDDTVTVATDPAILPTANEHQILPHLQMGIVTVGGFGVE